MLTHRYVVVVLLSSRVAEHAREDVRVKRAQTFPVVCNDTLVVFNFLFGEVLFHRWQLFSANHAVEVQANNFLVHVGCFIEELGAF